jgi:hypothetical protein
MPQPKIEYINSFDTAQIKAEPKKSKEEQKRDAEKIQKEWEKNRQQNPSFIK